MLVQDFIPWQGKLTELTLYDGESTTVQILHVDSKRNELVVDILDSNRPYPGTDHRAFAIPIGDIVSVYPAPASVHPRRPLSPPDPCHTRQPFSLLRFVAFTFLFLTFIPGGFFLFLLLADEPFGFQLASLVIDTAAVALFTFSSNKGLQPYQLFCPVVRRQLPRLLRRHAGFLAALFILQTAAFELRPALPAFWVTAIVRSESPFVIVLTMLCASLAFAQILSNRSLLGQAHLELAPPAPAG